MPSVTANEFKASTDVKPIAAYYNAALKIHECTLLVQRYHKVHLTLWLYCSAIELLIWPVEFSEHSASIAELQTRNYKKLEFCCGDSGETLYFSVQLQLEASWEIMWPPAWGAYNEWLD